MILFSARVGASSRRSVAQPDNSEGSSGATAGDNAATADAAATAAWEVRDGKQILAAREANRILSSSELRRSMKCVFYFHGWFM